MFARCQHCDCAQDVEQEGLTCWQCGHSLSDEVRRLENSRPPSNPKYQRPLTETETLVVKSGA